MKDSALHMIHWHPSQEKKYRDSSQDEAADGCSMPSFIPSRSARCSPEVQQSMQLPSTSEHDEIRYTECDQVNRPRLTQHQHFGLEEYFLSHPKPNTKIKQQLATKYGLSLTRVQNWFQNRRAKEKQNRRLREIKISQDIEAAGFNLADKGSMSSMNPVRPVFTPVEYVPPGTAKPPSSTRQTSARIHVDDAPVPIPYPAASYSSPRTAARASVARVAKAGRDASAPPLAQHQRNVSYPDFNRFPLDQWAGQPVITSQGHLGWPSLDLQLHSNLQSQAFVSRNTSLYPEFCQADNASGPLIFSHAFNSDSQALHPNNWMEDQEREMAGCQINGGMMNSDLNMGFGSPVMADPAQSSGYGNRVPYPVPQIAVPTPTIAARRNRPHLATLRSGNMRSHSSVGKMSSPAGSNAQNPVDCSIVRRSHSANASRLAHNRIRSTHPYWQQAPSPLHYTTFAEVGDSHQEDAYQQEPDGSSPCYQLSRPKPGFLEQVPLTPLSPIDRQSVPYPTAFKRLASGRSSFGQSSQASTPAKLPVLPLNTQFSFVSPPMTPGSQSLYSANSHSGYDLSSAGPIDFSSYLNYRDPLQDSLASLHDSVGSSALHDQGILYFDHVPNPTTENRPNVAQPRSVDEFGLGRTNPISPQLSVPESRAAIAGFLEFELPRRTGQSEPQFLSQASTVRQQQPQAAQHQRHLSRQSVENCQLGPMENAFFDLEPWTYNFDTTVDHRTDFLAPIV